MAYTDSNKVCEAWADITEEEGGAARIASAIIFSDAIIDASLAHRYTVPFNPTPNLIESISTDFAAYIAKYRKDPRMVTSPQSEGERQVAIAANLLDQLRKGEINLPNVTQKQMVKSTMEDYAPVFNLDEEIFHVLDEDLVDDIEDSRD
jgi:phage gp36-like protein